MTNKELEKRIRDLFLHSRTPKENARDIANFLFSAKRKGYIGVFNLSFKESEERSDIRIVIDVKYPTPQLPQIDITLSYDEVKAQREQEEAYKRAMGVL